MSFSPLYTDLYAASRCGKMEAFHELVRLGEEGDNLARGYHAVVLLRCALLSMPTDLKLAASIMREILPWLLERAEESENYDNVAHVWYILGVCLVSGVGDVVEKNCERAVQYFQLGSDKGHSLAQCALGNCYDVGNGVKSNMTKALQYYILSAEQNLPMALSNVAMCYERGEGAAVDMEMAFKYAKLAAEQEYAVGYFILALYLYLGKSVPVDVSLAHELAVKGADQGDVDCLYLAGELCMQVVGLENGVEKGFGYLLKAADHNHIVSQCYVGKCYKLGVGVSPSIVDAVRYLRRAARNEVEEANGILKTPTLIAEYKQQVIISVRCSINVSHPHIARDA